MQSETFSAYLKDKHRAKAQQLEKADRDAYGNNPYAMQAQYQAMMQMMMMSMMQNPQQQMMMMQMFNPSAQFGAQTGANFQRGNLFVRKAKGGKGESNQGEGKPKGGSHSARQGGNFGRDNKQDKKVPEKPTPKDKDDGRDRLD